MSSAPSAPGATFACIAGGGTAGHLLPGLAVAEALVERGHERASIHFVGGSHGPETTTVPAAGFPLTTLPGRGIPRRLSLASIAAALGVARGVVSGVGLIRRLRPRVVVVLGGYAAVPCTIGAIVWRVPIVVMEQNARAGAANRLAGRFAKAAAVPFEDTDLPRAVLTGNPVRPEILAVDRTADRHQARAQLDLPHDRVVLAVFSGSLGSRRINEAVAGLARRWSARSDLMIHHVVGARDWDAGPGDQPGVGSDDGSGDGSGDGSEGIRYRRVRYEDRMPLLLSAADLAICRAGGSTVAELAAVGLGAILVPLPIATRDHQTANAAPLVRAGAAVVVPDDQLDVDRLEAELTPLLAETGRLDAMARAARTLALPDAAERVADLVEQHARHAR
ncbi:MAG: UDP-N-acetylglucosamine--N-acetylmuramyl-(pentapeptide) pyrophosphoryl-undecaprenol N-acetylglucosamine transferase [Acidimicrobiales bacterium]